MTTADPVRLGEVVDLLAGYPFKSERFSSHRSDIAIVKGENVMQGYIDWEIAKRWPADEWQSLAKFQLAVDDVIVAMDRPWVPAGLKWASIRQNAPRALLVQRCARLRSSSLRLDQRFLRFVIGGSGFESYVRPITTGVNVPHISGKQILDFEFWLPPPTQQRRIASILSAYDDLIENCQRRIRILQDMARGLYREWFIHFRYPGADSLPRVDSSLGPIPQGWKVKRLGEILELNYGKALKKENRLDGSVPVFASSGVVGFHDSALARGPGLIVGRKGNVGSVYWSDTDFFVIDTAYYVTARLPLRFLFYDLQTKNFINNDSAVPGLSRHQAYALDTLVPPMNLLARFCELADSFEAQVATLGRKITNLRRTRDLLLPRLMSGQINVAPRDTSDDESAPAPAPSLV